MKKIIPFKKELSFKNNVAEIVSISLEHTLHHERDYLISGEFIITGDYKVTDASINTENFDFKIPFDINIDDKYELDHMVIDIDDFYYEIMNNNSLIVNIEVLLDKLEEKERCIDDSELLEANEIIESTFNNTDFELDDKKEIVNEKIIKANEKIEEASDKLKELKEKIKGFVTYRVCILKEEDNVDKILERYKIDRDILEQYNNLQDLKIGDKLIIPDSE